MCHHHLPGGLSLGTDGFMIQQPCHSDQGRQGGDPALEQPHGTSGVSGGARKNPGYRRAQATKGERNRRLDLLPTIHVQWGGNGGSVVEGCTIPLIHIVSPIPTTYLQQVQSEVILRKFYFPSDHLFDPPIFHSDY